MSKHLAHHHLFAHVALQSLVAGADDVHPKVVAVEELFLLLHLHPDDLTRA